MNWPDLLLRAKAIVRRRRMEEDLDEEVRAHLEFQTRKHMAAGLNAAQARSKARVEFGGVELAKENCRDARRVSLIDDLRQDMHYAVRALRRDPMLALIALMTLAICIGANTTVFSLVNSVMLRPLPYPAPDRLYWIAERMGRDQAEVITGADYYSLRAGNKIFEDIAAYNTFTLNRTGVERPEQLDAAQVTPSFFNVLATQPLMGRYLAVSEKGPKAPAVVVLSYVFWHSRLASDPHILGKTISLDGVPNTVIGVMPQGFDYPKGALLWQPSTLDEAGQLPRLVTRPMRLVSVLARLKPEISQPALDTDLNRLTNIIYREYPKEFASGGFLKGMQVLATPLQRRMIGDLRPALLVLSGAVALVLFIACANLANLLLARATVRRRELAVRMALGSGRARIIKQVLTESLVLALPGGAAGVLIAFFAVWVLNAWKPLILQNYPPLTLDLTTLLFTLGVTVLTGLVFGMVPALSAAGIGIQEALKSSGHTQTGNRGTARLRYALVVAELGMSLVLLIGAGLLGKSFLNLSTVPLGFSPENILTLRFNLTGSRYAAAQSQVDYYERVLERIKQLPQVKQAAISADLPLSGERNSEGSPFQVTGRPPLPMAQQPNTNISRVSQGFFATLGIPLRSGRLFDSQDTARAPDNIVVNEAFARKIFPGENALGGQIFIGPNFPVRWTIVGIVGNTRAGQLGVEPEPLVYRCLCQGGSPFEGRTGLLVRTAVEPRSAVHAIESQIYSVDRNEPVFDVKTMDERLADSLAPQRFHLLLIGIFAVVAIGLAAVGVYGVMTYLVTQRSREIGIRVALGAQLEDVLRLVLGETLKWTTLAMAAGLGFAWALTRYLTSMLYGVTALDVMTFAAMPFLLTVIALTATLAPALRALRIDPATVLREE
jgi:putative ABC transport system permease protein